MDRITADSLEKRGIQDQYICATCGRLAGPVVAMAGVFHQTCRCSRSEYVQIPDRDLSQEAEL